MSDSDQTCRSPEHELLLCCARVNLLDPDLVTYLVNSQLNWETLYREADHHRIIPSVFHHLSSNGRGTCPTSIWKQLRAESARILGNNMQQFSALHQFIPKFDQAGIEFLMVKGPVLSSQYYGGLGIRPFSDIDILVRREDVEQAINLTEELGFYALYPLAPDWQRKYIQRYSELLFLRKKAYAAIDLHWSLLPKGYSFTPQPTLLWNDTRRVTIQGLSIPVPSPENMFMFLCLHAAKHNWNLLQWLVDISELVQTESYLHWDAILASAEASGAKRIVCITMSLCVELLGVEVPDNVRRLILADSATKDACDKLRRKLLRTSIRPSHRVPLPWESEYFHAMEKRRDRIRFVYDTLFRPSVAEWYAFPLPSSLAPLYFAIRPVRLCYRKLKRILKKK